MRTAVVLIAVIGALIAGCGDGEEAPSQRPATTQRANDLSAVRDAIRTLQAQGASAGRGTAGISEAALIPSERGAAYLVDGGYVNQRQFCAADNVEFMAEQSKKTADALARAGIELGWAEKAFLSGWNEAASGEVRGHGSALYNALWTRCL